MKIFSYLILLMLIFSFMGCNLKADTSKDIPLTKDRLDKEDAKKDIKKEECKCSYDTYYGNIIIISVKQTLEAKNQEKLKDGFKGFDIKFNFITEDKINNDAQKEIINKSITFKLANNMFPGERFIKKYQINKNTWFGEVRLGFLNNNAKNCEKITYEIKGVNRADNVDLTIGEVIPVKLENRIYKRIREKRLLKKPVLYLYPKEKTEITVKLKYYNDIKYSYPKYPENGWVVTADKNGKIYYNDREYYSLFWEMYNYDDYLFNEGFLVKKENLINFLENSLKKLGFEDREANEFIIFWLPYLEENELNLIKFETVEYSKNQPIEITPKPDTLIRVMMIYRSASNKDINIKNQELKIVKRRGFVALEWGGMKIK